MMTARVTGGVAWLIIAVIPQGTEFPMLQAQRIARADLTRDGRPFEDATTLFPALAACLKTSKLAEGNQLSVVTGGHPARARAE